MPLQRTARALPRSFHFWGSGSLVVAVVGGTFSAVPSARAEPRPSAPAPTAVPSPSGASDNRTEPPLESEDLTERARQLFDAIAADQPELANAFFFPREPFLPLKDVKDPGRYHAELVRRYHHDVHALHAARRSWQGASFRDIRLGSPPKWVKPGEEWNKIGYFRTFDAKLGYAIGGRARTLVVRTLISWDGRWYVTHLLPLAGR